ncbi:hypothetical protein [Mesorhizobium sp. LNJC395A00]|nr:hypothetical protein [Mesorhizobium sp. LNJC395A00]WJI78266.1 hypothetical protein NLY37_28555 [Mesorhizobium sp. C395A]
MQCLEAIGASSLRLWE